MKHVSRTVVAVTMLSLCVAVVSTAVARQPDLKPAFRFDFEPVELPKPYGWVDMRLHIEPLLVICDSLTLRFFPEDGLLHEGPDSVVVAVPEDGGYEGLFRFYVAPDTSNVITVEILCDKKRLVYRSRCFLTRGDSLRYINHSTVPHQRRRPVVRQPQIGNITPGKHPHNDSLQGIPAPPDESTDRGEYMRQLLECIEGLPDGTVYDVYLELDDPSKMALAELVTDTLVPTETEHQYLTRADGATVKTLCEGDIWSVFKCIHIEISPNLMTPLVEWKPDRGRLVDSAFTAMMQEMEKSPLLDSARETLRLNNWVFVRERGESKFRYSHSEDLPQQPMTLDSLMKLEETPLTGRNSEYYKIDSFAYRRERGERRFRKTRLITDGEAEYWRFYDSLNAVHDEKQWWIIDLTDPLKYETARHIVTTLLPTERPGFYRAFINRGTTMELAKQEIRCEPEDR